MEQFKKRKFFKKIIPYVIIFTIFAYIGWVYVGLNHMKIMGGPSDHFLEHYIGTDGKEILQYNFPYIKEVILWVVSLPLVCTLFIAFLKRIVTK
jgi:hypothetical protein